MKKTNKLAFAATVGGMIANLTVPATGLHATAQPSDAVRSDTIVTTAADTIMTQRSLQEIEIAAARPLIHQQADRISYDVAADKEATTASVMTLLRKVPGVVVDDRGGITIDGQNNFKIYRNGKPSPNLTDHAKELLAAMPAEQLKSIEVITHPGATFDAEGGEIILNLITNNRHLADGLLCNVRGMTGNADVHTTSLFATTQIKKFNLDVNYSGQSFGDKAQQFTSDGLRSFIGDNHTLGEHYITVTPTKLHSASLMADYHFSDHDILSASADGIWMHCGLDKQGLTTLTDADDKLIYTFDERKALPHYRRLEGNIRLDFTHSTHREGETLSAAYLYNAYRQDLLSDQVFLSATALPFGYNALQSEQSTDFDEHTLQFDWSRPLCKQFILSTGTKYIYRQGHGNTRFSYADATEVGTHFTHTSHIGALYGSLAYTATRWNCNGGLRYEVTKMQSLAQSTVSDNGRADRKLSDWIPSAAAQLQIDSRQSLSLHYSMRIKRPDISYLNPAAHNLPTSQTKGNPDLVSMRRQAVGLSYRLSQPKLTLTVAADYKWTRHGISPQIYVTNDIICQSYDNRGNYHASILTAQLNWQLWERTGLMTNATLTRLDINYATPSDLHKEQWLCHAFVQLTQRLPWQLQWIAAGGRNGGYSESVYGHDKATLYYFFRLSRSFLKDGRLNVEVATHNPFSSSHVCNVTYYDRGNISGSETSYYLRRNLQLTLSLRLGRLTPTRPSGSHAIVNDDLERL